MTNTHCMYWCVGGSAELLTVYELFPLLFDAETFMQNDNYTLYQLATFKTTTTLTVIKK